jgi:processive 1,2-diacylglycerol beta-glucosyltransferase
MVDCIEYINKALNKVTTKAYSGMAKNAHWMWKKVYYGTQDGTFAKLNDKAQKILSIKLNKLINSYKLDLIISTHFFSSHMCAILKKKKKINSKIVTILTDYVPHSQWLMYPAYIDYFFVAHEGMKEDLLKRGIRETQIKVTGIPLSNRFLAHYDKEKILSDFGLSMQKRTILFFAGGEQGFGKDKIFNMLKSIIESFPNLQIIAISGKNAKMKQQFDELVEKNNSHENVKILEYTNKVPELMSVSDLVITKPGGLTTTESLASRSSYNSN